MTTANKSKKPSTRALPYPAGLAAIAALVLMAVSPHQLLSSDPPVKKVYTTSRINPHNPVIDGRIDDAVWDKVEWAGDFVQREPHEGKPPTEPTSFKILYDEKNLYVAIRAHDREPDRVVKRLARRDNNDGDWVEIQLDSYNDHLTAFCLQVNAAGVKSDMFLSADGEVEDQDWNPIWDVETAVDEGGWTAEMRIPLSQLRYAGGTQTTWGLQVRRKFFRSQETSVWQFIPRDASGWVSPAL